MMHRRAGRCPRPEGAEAVRRASYGPAKRVLLETLLALEQTRSGAWTIAAGGASYAPAAPGGTAALPECGADALLLFRVRL